MGRVLVVGGSPEYVGALYLAAISALRCGAESVIVMAPEKIAWTLNRLSPDLMTRKLKGAFLTASHEKRIGALLKTADVLLVGNGAGTRPGTATLMQKLMRWKGAKVVDADALKVLRGGAVTNAILTPNEGEWKLLVQRNDIKKLLEENVIIKKGRATKILSHSRTTTVRANLGLTKAGSGDVLAGACAGFVASGFGLEAAAREATTLGNRIANILAKRKKGYYFLASDLLKEIRAVRKARAA